MHCAHDAGVGVKSSASKTDVSWTIVAVAFHQSSPTTDYPDGQTAGNGLPVRHQISTNAEVFLRSTWREAKAEKDLVENKNNASLGTKLAQLLKPSGVSRLIEVGAPRAVHQRGVG